METRRKLSVQLTKVVKQIILTVNVYGNMT